MVCQRKNVGRSAKLYKRAPKCQSLSQKLAHFGMEDSKNPLLVVDKDNHLSKPIFISLFYK
jgi:hypothetical protein